MTASNELIAGGGDGEVGGGHSLEHARDVRVRPSMPHFFVTTCDNIEPEVACSRRTLCDGGDSSRAEMPVAIHWKQALLGALVNATCWHKYASFSVGTLRSV